MTYQNTNTMRNLKPYVAIIENRKDLKMIKDLYNNSSEHYSEECRRVYYMSYERDFKVNQSVVIVPLKKVLKGRVIYLCSSVYGVGKFLFITDKEFNKLNELSFKCEPKVYISEWRYLHYYEGVLNEFEHPLIMLQNKEIELNEAQKDFEYKSKNISEKKAKLLARF